MLMKLKVPTMSNSGFFKFFLCSLIFFSSCSNNNNFNTGVVKNDDDFSKKSLSIYDNYKEKKLENLNYLFSEDLIISLNDSYYYNFEEFVAFLDQNQSFFNDLKFEQIDIKTLKLNYLEYVTNHKIKFIFNEPKSGVAIYINSLIEFNWRNNEINEINVYYDSSLFREVVNFNTISKK